MVKDILWLLDGCSLSLHQLCSFSGMSKQTLYKHFRDLEELGVVVVSRRIGRAVLYKLNREHPLVKMLKKMIHETSLMIAEQKAKKQAIPVSEK